MPNKPPTPPPKSNFGKLRDMYKKELKTFYEHPKQKIESAERKKTQRKYEHQAYQKHGFKGAKVMQETAKNYIKKERIAHIRATRPDVEAKLATGEQDAKLDRYLDSKSARRRFGAQTPAEEAKTKFANKRRIDRTYRKAFGPPSGEVSTSSTPTRMSSGKPSLKIIQGGMSGNPFRMFRKKMGGRQRPIH